MNRIDLKVFKQWTLVCLILVLASVAFSQKKETDLKPAAANYLLRHEFQLQQSNDLEQFNLLKHLAPAALAAGETEKAQNYAKELLTTANKIQSNSKSRHMLSYTGYATHISNIILGRLALDAGNIDEAKQYLLAVGQVNSVVPVLASFGPNMLLAKQLIEKGERETVIQYFDLCTKFWKMENGKLEQWKNVVKQGGTPDFGANLTLVLDGWRFAGD